MARDVLERETAALREPDERDALGGNTLLVEIRDERRQGAKRGGEKRFVLINGCQKRVGIPGPAGRLGRHVRHVWQVERLGDGEDALGRRAASVDQDRDKRRLSRRRAATKHGLAGVRITHSHRPTSRQYVMYAAPKVRRRYRSSRRITVRNTMIRTGARNSNGQTVFVTSAAPT